jgi:hypothetical protein
MHSFMIVHQVSVAMLSQSQTAFQHALLLHARPHNAFAWWFPCCIAVTVYAWRYSMCHDFIQRCCCVEPQADCPTKFISALCPPHTVGAATLLRSIWFLSSVLVESAYYCLTLLVLPCFLILCTHALLCAADWAQEGACGHVLMLT